MGGGAHALKKGDRLDAVLVERGLAATRERARALILAGQVRINGQTATKAGASVPPGAMVTLDAPDHPYVGRGGLKLARALDVFGVSPSGRIALDKLYLRDTGGEYVPPANRTSPLVTAVIADYQLAHGDEADSAVAIRCRTGSTSPLRPPAFLKSGSVSLRTRSASRTFF